MEAIQLMLVDDHDVIRQGMKSLFDGFENLHVIAEAQNGKDAVDRIKDIHPDVILMDITMPEMDGIEATRLINISQPDCKIIALTVHEDSQFFQQMMIAGASGYVTKRSLADEVILAIETVMKGGVYLSPHFAKMLLTEFLNCKQHHGKTSPPVIDEITQQKFELLSKREKQVAAFVAEGLRSQAIGEQLGISTPTVSRHRARIMDKLNLETTADLVRFAIKSGLISI
ncbi:MAG: response regulator transcription factor [Chloroflexota bacterium]